MRILAFLLSAMACAAVFAESMFESFEKGLPDYAEASRPAGISASDKHYKLGKKSLEWNWNRGDTITFKHGIGNIYRTGGYSGTYSKAAFGVWVYCEKAQNGFLRFKFQSKGKTGGHFDFSLGFTGWRRATLRYSWKPAFKGRVSADTDRILIEAHGAAESGRCFIDLMVYNGIIDYRDQMVPGEIKWSPVKPDPEKYPLPEQISEAEKAGIEKIGKAMSADSLDREKAKSIDFLEKRFKKFNIVESKSEIKGQPLVGEPRSQLSFYTEGVGCKGLQTPKEISALMKDIAVSYILPGPEKEKFAAWYVQLARHLNDQGFTAGGNWWNWYYGRDLARATFLMRNVLRENNFLKEPAEFFDYNYKTSVIFDVETINPDMDIFHINTRNQLNSALMQKTLPEIVRALKAFSKYLSAEILFEGRNGFKIDGCAFHHGGHYYCYARYALNSLMVSVKALSGTPFAISRPAYQRLKKVLLSMRFYCGLKEPYLSLHGRHPFSPGGIQANAFYNLALSSPAGIDPELAAAYIRLAPESPEADTLRAKGFRAEETPHGHQTFNMGAFTVHRRGNWLATAKGYSKYVWHGETYQKNNRYGRYLSNGSLGLIFGSGIKSSGLRQNGFDWNRIDGATVIYLPLNELKTKGGTEMLKNNRHFVGGLSYFGQNGLFTTQLESKYAPGFSVKKSFFFIDDMIVCMGSNIVNPHNKKPVQTNLFQRVLPSENTPIVVDGSKVTAFPDDKKLSVSKAHWLLDPQGSGYYISAGANVEYSRKHQYSRNEQDTKDTEGNFAAAWINHRVNPKNASYLYYVFPVSSIEKMRQFAEAMSARDKPVRIIKQDADAHVINIPAKKLWAAVLFKAQKTPFMPLITEVERPCLIMLSQAGKNYELTVTDPDLNFNKQGKFGVASRRTAMHLKLQGKWKLKSAGKDISILKRDDKNTVLKINCHDGLSNDIILSP